MSEPGKIVAEHSNTNNFLKNILTNIQVRMSDWPWRRLWSHLTYGMPQVQGLKPAWDMIIQLQRQGQEDRSQGNNALFIDKYETLCTKGSSYDKTKICSIKNSLALRLVQRRKNVHTKVFCTTADCIVNKFQLAFLETLYLGTEKIYKITILIADYQFTKMFEFLAKLSFRFYLGYSTVNYLWTDLEVRDAKRFHSRFCKVTKNRMQMPRSRFTKLTISKCLELYVTLSTCYHCLCLNLKKSLL